MEYGKLLIDKAGEKCGSFYRLSKETGFPQSHISEVRSGKRNLPVEWVPVLAELVGEDPRDALARVVAERLPEGSRARALLGGAYRTGVAAMLLLCVVLGQPQPSNAYEVGRANSTSYTSWNIWRTVRRLFFRTRGIGAGGPGARPWTLGLFADTRRGHAAGWALT